MLIKSQPSLFASVQVSGNNNDGAALADFYADFIQRYSERLKNMRESLIL
jgi:hypothetical protein